MNKSQKPSKPSKQKPDKQQKRGAAITKFFYVFILLLLLSASLIRLAGASRPSPQSNDTPTPQNAPAAGGMAALVLTFYQEDSKTGACQDLVIPATGSAVYSDCGNDQTLRYDLSAAERAQVQNWIARFEPINYDHTDQSQAGEVVIQLYLNGQGSQGADAMETQQIIDFAASLASKIAAQE